jgi:hypothetical protein
MRTTREFVGDVLSSTVLAIALVAIVLAAPKVVNAFTFKDLTDTWCRAFPSSKGCPQVQSNWRNTAPRATADPVAPADTIIVEPPIKAPPTKGMLWLTAPIG